MAGAPHLDAFLNAARSFIGLRESKSNRFPASDPRGAELWKLWGSNASGTSWCAIFVSACGVKAGVSGSVIGKNAGASGIAKATVKLGGTWIDGPYLNGGNPVTPMPGDIINFGNAQYHGHNHAYHVGIVEYVEGNKVHTIEGNSSNQCRRKEYSLGDHSINLYVRPNWGKVGDDVSAYVSGAVTSETQNQQVVLGPLYENRNDRHDMTLREICYLNGKYALSDNPSGITISAINYTSVLGDLYDMFPPVIPENIPQIDTSQLSGNEKITVDFFLDFGFTASAACALAGCMYLYSGINPSNQTFLNGKYRYGICAWEQVKLKTIKNRVGSNWQTDLSGQLRFFLDDLHSNYNLIYQIIKSQPMDKSDVDDSVKALLATYVSGFSDDKYIKLASGYANSIYGKLIITSPAIVGSSSILHDINGNTLSARYNVPIPTSVKQTGIINDYTSYSHYYSKWKETSPQRKLARLWGEQGFPCDKGIAMIGGYYCVAVKPKFGKCGEVIVVTLENGTTFNAIICDEKGEDAKSEWGHPKGGGKISLIEWERVKTVNGKVITTGTKHDKVDPIGFKDWYGKKVVSIANYGKYIDVKWS
jgi:hypothetical protein